jgi:hypothetical protein
MKKIKYLIPAVALMFGFASCDNMDELYKDYKADYSIYSTPVGSVSGIPGKERVILSWKNPQDKVAKGIKIYWNEGEESVTLNEMVEEYSIEGLAAGTYVFEVRTFDAWGNESLLKSATVKAYGPDDIRNVPMPAFSIAVAEDYTHVLNISDVSSPVGNWGGLFEITATSPSGETFDVDLSQEFNILEKKKSSLGNAYYSRALAFSVPLGQTLEAGEWKFSYKFSTHPGGFQVKQAGIIYYTSICVDPYTIENESTINVAAVEIPEPEAPAEGEETEETPAE